MFNVECIKLKKEKCKQVLSDQQINNMRSSITQRSDRQQKPQFHITTTTTTTKTDYNREFEIWTADES